MRWTFGEDLKEDRSHQVDVAGDCDLPRRSNRHFRGHVRRSTSQASFRFAGNGYRQSPVHDQNFTKITQHGVFRLQIAVDHSTRIRKRHCVRTLHQNLEVFGKRLFLYYFTPRCSNNALHRIEKRPVTVQTEVIDWDDVGMVQLSSHHCLGQKFLPLRGLIGDLRQHLLNCDLAVDGRLSGHIHDAHAAFAEPRQQLVVGYCIAFLGLFHQVSSLND